VLRSHRPSLRTRKEPPRTEGITTPAHEKSGSEPETEADVKRDQVEKLEAIPQAQMLFDSVSTKFAPSVIAEIPKQTAMSQEAAERVLSHWAESEDDGEKEAKEPVEDDEPYKEHGMAMEFQPDSAIAAANYLAPDEASKVGDK
jgi:hypothetical protein